MGRKQPSSGSGSASQQQQRNANELLNFRFAASAASRQETSLQNHSRSTSNNNFNRNRPPNQQQNEQRRQNQNHQQRRRNNKIRQQDRSSARKKASSSMFYLHSSAEHAFILTRRSVIRNINCSSNNNCESSSSDPQPSYSFNGSDESVSWDAVRMVKQLVPLTAVPLASGSVGGRNGGTDEVKAASVATVADEEPSCPICLSTLICPRITKCGHVFCLSCLLRHVQTYSANNPYQDVKCPCCALPVVINDLRTVVFEYVVPPRVVAVNSGSPHYYHHHHRGSSQPTIKLRKLHRQKQCSAPYLPVPDAYMHSNPHSAPSYLDDDARFCRFNYIDPEFYLQTLTTHQNQLIEELSSLPPPTAASAAGGAGTSHKIGCYAANVERIYLNMALEIVLKQQERARTDFDEEKLLEERFAQPTAGMYQPQSPALLYRKESDNITAGEAKVEDDNSPCVKNDTYDGRDNSTMEQKLHDHTQMNDRYDFQAQTTSMETRLGRQYRGDSIGSCTSMNSIHTPLSSHIPMDDVVKHYPLSPGNSSIASSSRNESSRVGESGMKNKTLTRKANVRRSQPYGSMYVHDDADTHLLYQADDGQLVFLNGFNMTCLLSDYARTRPDAASTDSDTSKPPLPDFIEGVVLEVENLQLTPELRKRMPFLSHIPSYTDILLVELDLFHILSESTRRKFKAEFAKRRQRRVSKFQAEKRADMAAELEEMERINDRKARSQMIDPDDEFFRASTKSEVAALSITSEDFGPVLSQINTREEVVVASQHSTVAPGTSSVSFSEACRRGQNDVMTISSTDAFPSLRLSTVETFPALSGGPVDKNKPDDVVSKAHAPQSTGGGGKKKKKARGQKISLFSTGGPRGY